MQNSLNKLKSQVSPCHSLTHSVFVYLPLVLSHTLPLSLSLSLGRYLAHSFLVARRHKNIEKLPPAVLMLLPRLLLLLLLLMLLLLLLLLHSMLLMYCLLLLPLYADKNSLSKLNFYKIK